MKHVPLSVLEGKLIRPGFEEHLKPLLRYRGCMSLGRVHRLLNLMISAMEHEATSADITQRLVLNPDYSQLCCPDKRVSLMSLCSFRSRLVGAPSVLAEFPGLAEYLDWMVPPWRRWGPLERLSDPPDGFAAAVERQSVAWAAREYGTSREICERWFRELGLMSAGLLKRRPNGFSAAARGKSLGWAVERYDVGYSVARRWFEEVGIEPTHTRTVALRLVYPFLIHDGGKPEHALLRKVTAFVPRGLDPSLRADMCQDLIVGILSGEIEEDALLLPSRELTRRIWKSSPARYGDRSLEEVIAGDDFTLMDTLADEGRDWA